MPVARLLHRSGVSSVPTPAPAVPDDDAPQRIVKVRRDYNSWVASETLEDYALRYTPQRFRKWSEWRVANTAFGAASFLILEAVGATLLVQYGFVNAFWAVLMTGLIISQARLPMDEVLTITQDDVDTEKGSSSRLRVGATLTRGQMLHLALMSSENRAAHALGRTYPGGLAAFVTQMNVKAKLLGMADTKYVEPTGLSSRNQSSARDLAVLVNVAHGDPLVRELSTSPGYEVAQGPRTLQYNNTNRLVKSPAWEIGLQKTGYISEAGQCLVMQAEVAGRKLIMVFLDSAGKFSRLADAERVRHWVENQSGAAAVLASHKIKG